MKYNNIYYIVPARMGSKGLPLKNRKLMEYAYHVLSLLPNVIISTDDDFIKDKYKNIFKIHNRPKELSSDTASMKDVLCNIAQEYKMSDNDIIITLYLTYPQRTINDVLKMLSFFTSGENKSLLCRKAVKTHPCLCVYDNGRQVIKHDFYRRQDYPVVFEISHFVSACFVSELEHLNKNLYNDKTFFVNINDKIDVDNIEDLTQFENSDMHSS